MVTKYNDKYSLTVEEFDAIKIIINRLAQHTEGVISCDISLIKDDHIDLYSALLDMQECWESIETIDAIEKWEEEINH